MKLPNFLVAGFPKCGSTSLHYYFNEHPDIFMPQQKELHFFTYDILVRQNKGKGDREVKKFHIGTLSEYEECYKNADGHTAIGDASPSYANYREAIPKIKKILGEKVKIIVVVRDPIKRAYSNYLHLVREDRETLSFYDALMEEERRIKAGYADFWYYTFNSLYAEKIQHLKAAFEDVYVLTFEDFIENSSDRIKDIYRFLGVNEEFIPLNLQFQFNPGGVYKQNPITKFIFRQSKLKTAVKRLIPLTPAMKKTKLRIIKRYKDETPSIDERCSTYLIERFKEDVNRLSQMGVKTAYWNQAFQENTISAN